MDIKDKGRRFEGIWIPRDIWLCNDLNIMEKVFLVEIRSLDNEDGCYANNQYFSEFFGVGKTRCSQIINSLKEKDLLQIDFQKKGKQIIKRTIKIKELEVFNFLKGGIENIKGGYLEKCKDNSILINNTVSTIVESDLFPKNKINKVSKSIFENSDVYLKKQFLFEKLPEFKELVSINIDVNYYIEKVKRWSNTKTGVKRNFKGWVGTVQNFIDSDNRINKIKYLGEKEEFRDEMREYFNRS